MSHGSNLLPCCAVPDRRGGHSSLPLLGEEAWQPQNAAAAEWDVQEQAVVPAMESRGGAGGASWCDRLKSRAGLHSQITSKILSSFPDKGDFGAEKVEPGQVAALSTRPRCCCFRAAAEGEAEQCWKVGAP